MNSPKDESRIYSGMPLPSATAVLLLILLTINAATYYLNAEAFWSSVAVICAELIIVFVASYVTFRQGFTWCSTFLALLAIFHVGYYLPARLGWIDEINIAPVSGPLADTAMLLFGAAILSFALGCALTPRRQSPRLRSDAISDAATARTALYAGLFITFLSFVCAFLFVIQIGGPLALLHLSYRDVFNFFALGGTENTRYWMSFLEYYPVGLLLVYFGLAELKAPNKYFRLWGICTVCAVAATLAFGNRGSTILLVVGWAYLRHHMVARLNYKIVGALAAGLIIAIPWIATHRNQRDFSQAVLEDAQFDPLAPAVEMGLTYRSLYAMVELMSDGTPSLDGRSYSEAIKRIVPLTGSNDVDKFSRTAIWLNKLADVIELAKNGTMGSSGIGEPFVNYGYFGVVIFFTLLGLGFAALERSFLNKGNLMAGAMLTVMIVPMGFYVRDDISSTLRACVWPWLLLYIVSKRAALAALLHRPDHQLSGSA